MVWLFVSAEYFGSRNNKIINNGGKKGTVLLGKGEKELTHKERTVVMNAH
jgi:hypothetical protein